MHPYTEVIQTIVIDLSVHSGWLVGTEWPAFLTSTSRRLPPLLMKPASSEAPVLSLVTHQPSLLQHTHDNPEHPAH